MLEPGPGARFPLHPRARLAAVAGAALPGSSRHTGRPTTASGARASRLQKPLTSRPGTTRCQPRRLASTLTLTLILTLASTLTLTLTLALALTLTLALALALTTDPGPGPDH